MENHLQIIQQCPLFEGVECGQLLRLLPCLGARTVLFQKGEIILLAGYHPSSTGIVLEGEIEATREDYSGSSSVITRMGPCKMFGDVLVSSEGYRSPVTVTAMEKSLILFLQYDKIVSGCSNACPSHSRVVANLLKVISQKYFALNQKIGYMTIRSLRSRIASYLLDQMAQAGDKTFNLPFDRCSLAGYLNADRSALSRELGRMREEGLIEFYKNSFKILNGERLKQFI